MLREIFVLNWCRFNGTYVKALIVNIVLLYHIVHLLDEML